MEQLYLKGRVVFLRLDLNVPLSDDGKIMDTTRIDNALPTIRYCLERAARLVICSHLGRPEGKKDPQYSLEPVGAYLAEMLNWEVVLVEGFDEGVGHFVSHGVDKSVALLENIRFDAGEEANDKDFARRLSRLGEVYINDAFGVCHRKHASVHALPSRLSECGVGFLIRKELKYLDRLLNKPPRPFFLVVGGSKVTDKLLAMDNLIDTANTILVGGAMAYAFLKAQDKEIGKSKCEHKGVAAAQQILRKAKRKGVRVILPVDHLVVDPEKDPKFQSPRVVQSIPSNAIALDIGPETIRIFTAALEEAESVFWNGPMGLFENPKYAKGTEKLGACIAGLSALKIAGGGDTVRAIKSNGSIINSDRAFDLVSTGGGASLAYLEGKPLPALSILKNIQKREFEPMDEEEENDMRRKKSYE